jgi:hypothetical protein
MKPSSKCNSSFRAIGRDFYSPRNQPFSDLTGKLVNRNIQINVPIKPPNLIRPNSVKNSVQTARTLIPDLQDFAPSKKISQTPALSPSYTNLLSFETKITNCERRHNSNNNSSKVFNFSGDSDFYRPIIKCVMQPRDRNVIQIGNKGATCIKDRALEPCIISPSKNIKNLRDFRSCIIGMPGSSTSRQPMSKDIGSSKEGYVSNKKGSLTVKASNQDAIVSARFEAEKKKGKKMFAMKDILIYGSLEKEEKKPDVYGRRLNTGVYNVFKSHLDGLA